MPSTPSSVARCVRCTAWRGSLEPVPATTVLPCGRLATASSMIRRCSSSLSVGASPVVPATTTPSEPVAQTCCWTATKASSSTRPSASNGVMIAVRIAPSAGMTRVSQGPRNSRIPPVADPVIVLFQGVREARRHLRGVALLPQRHDEQLVAVAVVAAYVDEPGEPLVLHEQRAALDARAAGGVRPAPPIDDLRLDVHGARARAHPLAVALGCVVGHGHEDPCRHRALVCRR